MRVAIYTRISTDEEHQPYSLESQQTKLAAYISSQEDWQLVKSFTDQASGAKLERPGLRQALAEARAGRFDLLLVYRVDRFSRSVRGLAQLLEELDAANVAFRSATEPFDTTTPAGRMMVQMLGVFAEFERATIIDRVISGMERKAARGEWTAGRRPYGYDVDKATKQLVVREDEAPLVPQVFDLYAHKRMGATNIAKALNERGHRTRAGRLWGKVTILGMLRNRVYIGEVFFRGQYHPASHPPLIDEELFVKAADLLAQRGDDHAKRQVTSAPDYLLTSLIVCSRCGRNFLGTSASGNRYRYQYYTCFTRNRYGTTTCSAERLPSSALDAAVLQALVETFGRSDLFEDAVRAATEQRAGLRDQHEAELAKVIDEQRKTAEAIERYLQAFENGTLDESLFGERIKALSARSTELRARREELEDAIANETVPMPSHEELQAIRNTVATALKEGDVAAQKRLVQEVVHEIRVQDRSHIVPVFKVPTTDESLGDPKVREMEGYVGVHRLELWTSAV